MVEDKTRYWVARAEVDFLYFQLETLLKKQISRKPIEKMIDEATGIDKETEKDCKRIGKRITFLRKKYNL